MKKIIGTFHLSNVDFKIFTEQLIKNIDCLQSDNQEVEIQYSTNTFSNGQVVYSALILGRKEE